MKVQILGMGCAKCKSLEQHARDAIAAAGIDAEVEKISDPVGIAEMGVMMTPALAIDGEVKSAGKLLGKEEIIAILEASK